MTCARVPEVSGLAVGSTNASVAVAADGTSDERVESVQQHGSVLDVCARALTAPRS